MHIQTPLLLSIAVGMTQTLQCGTVTNTHVFINYYYITFQHRRVTLYHIHVHTQGLPVHP